MTRRREEDRSLEAYYKWLQLKGWSANYHHVGNELPVYSKEMQIFAANLKRKGKKAGFSDILILEQHQGYGALFIELKTIRGRASFEQLAFLHNVNNNGYLGVVAFGIDSAKRITKWYMQNQQLPPPFIIKKRKSKGIDFDSLEVN